MDNPKEILIVHTWGLGDMILLTPVLNAVSLLCPELRFSYLIFPRIAAEPVINRKDTASVFYAERGFRSIISAILKLRTKSFYAVMLSSGVTPWKAWLFIIWFKARYKILEIHSVRFPCVQHQVPFIDSVSRSESNYSLLGSILPLPSWDVLLADREKYSLFPTFPLKDENLEFALEFLEQHKLRDATLTIVHPGCMAKNKYRRWKKEYFKELILMILDRCSHKVLIVGGPDELDVAEYLSKECKVPLLYERNLANVAAVLSKADFFINTDSGIGHLASCFQLRMLTIFGPGDERQTAPFTPNSRIIRKDLSCSPCIGKKRNPCLVECLNKLTPAEVFAKFLELIH